MNLKDAVSVLEIIQKNVDDLQADPILKNAIQDLKKLAVANLPDFDEEEKQLLMSKQEAAAMKHYYDRTGESLVLIRWKCKLFLESLKTSQAVG